jgi:catecholate siderophore receptor
MPHRPSASFGPEINLARLRTGAALGLALAFAAGAASAQEAPGSDAARTDVAETVAAGPQEETGPQQQRDRARDDEDRPDSIFVFGRKVTTSVSTLPNDPPQVVNVISAETLQEQGVTSLEQALRNVPGITTQIGEGGQMNGDQFFIRGFAAKDDIYTDGLRDFGVFTRDSFNYGQVEVLKGPSSTTLGRGTTGGGINTTSKVPFLDEVGQVTLAAGNAEYGRATADWNHVIGDGMAVRLNAMVHHNQVEGRDFIQSDRWGVAPSIGFGLDGQTSVTIAGFYQHDERVPDYGIPTATIPFGATTRSVPLSRLGVASTNYYGYESDTDESDVYTITVRARHEVNDWLTLTSDSKYGNYTRYFQQTVPNACADTLTSPATGATRCATYLLDNNPATIPLINIGGPGPYDQTTQGVQNVTVATITAPVGGFRNELMLGWDVSWQTNDRDQFNYVTTGPTIRAPKDVFNPNRTPSPTLQPVKNNIRESTANDVSLFVSERFWFNDQWSVSGGVRAQWYEMDQNSTVFTVTNATTNAFTTAYVPLSSNSDFVSPRLSVIWEPSMDATYYVSYATSATPPGITVSNGSAIAAPGAGAAISAKDLDPEENTSIEAGARFELFGNLLVQASIFQIEKNNAKDIDPLSGALITSGDSQRARGVELGLGGSITPLWGFNFTYAYTDATTTESATAANVGQQVQYVPEQAASLWTTYNFERPLAGLQAGFGVTYQDRVFLNAANTSQSPSFISLDGMVSYAFDRYRVSLNAYNLLDDLYYSQVNGNRVVPAQGRSFVATLGVAF